jgi:DNA polymerase-1
LKGKLKEKIELNKELGILSKKLATIITDVPINYDIKNFTLSPQNLEETKKIFDELEFRRLSSSLNSIFTNSKNIIENVNSLKKNNESIGADFGQFSLFDNQISSNNINKLELMSQKIISERSMNLFLSRLKNQKKVSYNLISDSDDFSLKEISLCWEKGITYEISKDCEGFKNILKQLFENKNILKISDDLKNDIKLIENEGIIIKGEIFDVKLAHYLINPDISHDLTNLSNSYLNTKINKKSTELLSSEIANINIQLAELLNKDLEKFKLLELYKSIEIPLLKTLSKMERVGVNLDSHFLKNLSKKTTKDLNILKEKIFKIAGLEFNISSPKQLGEVLFDRLKISSKPKKTKTGQYSTSEDILAELVDENIIIKLILEYRSISKLLNTYIDSLPNQVCGKSGRIHTQYVQTVASTGRLSSINPNLQNIPIRSERGREIRKAFIAKNKDYFILAADYSQIELRIIASISKEENMINAFKNNEDIHAATASSVFNVPISNVSREQRSNAKIVNFGIIYGVSAFGLSNQTDLNRNESKLLIDTYYKKYPRLKEYISDQISFARNNGYVQTLLGRRRYLKDINSRNAVVRGTAERNAINAPIQGSAADIIKIAMINIQNKLESEDYQSKMLLQVHDELVFDVFKPELNRVINMVKSEMMNAYKIEVPLKVDINYGLNWLEAH